MGSKNKHNHLKGIILGFAIAIAPIIVLHLSFGWIFWEKFWFVMYISYLVLMLTLPIVAIYSLIQDSKKKGK